MPSITEPSICIPRLSTDITKPYIKNIFEQIFGNNSIERIDLVKKTYSSTKIYYTAFIHFNYWNDTSNVQAIRNRIMNNQTFKIVYSEPWFWKCSISKAIKPLIYTQYNDTRIIKRYQNTNIDNDPYNEVVEEINNIINEHITNIPHNNNDNSSLLDNFNPPSITRQYPINCPNIDIL